jgi:2-amino-4-hydroxy-6-hydroxymethyldihydropteridine diphosphokinase
VSDEFNKNSDKNWTRAYIGLGSNEGDRLGYVQQAMQLLKDYPGIEVVECSSLYETEPVGNEYEEWFVNAVAAIETSLSATDLLRVCKETERTLSRLAGADGPDIVHEAPGGSFKSRIIDLDILFFGNKRVKLPDLIVPHPQLTKRAYALVPLLEIAPEFIHPTLGKTVAQLHENLDAPEQVFLYGTRNPIADFEP